MLDYAPHKMTGTFGQIQIGTHGQDVLIDTTARFYDVAGHRHSDNSFVRLSLSDARRLQTALSRQIAAAEEAVYHQPGLWSDATLRATAERLA